MTNSIPPPPPAGDAPPPPPGHLPPPPPPPPVAKIAPRKVGPVLDIDKIIQQRKEAEGPFKPRFIPKKERERIAREKAEKEKDVQKTASSTVRFSKYPEPPKGPRNAETEEQKQSRTIAEHELAERKRKYLGEPKRSTFSAHKKRRRNDQKFRFDWSDSEDTSAVFNPLPTMPSWPKVQIGGFDFPAREEIEHQAALIIKNDPETGHARAQIILDRDRVSREVAAKKSRHWTEKGLQEMSQRDWRIFKEDFDITTKGSRIPNPIRSWKESNLPSRLLDVVSQVGYNDPSPIQRAAIPIALQSRDLIGVAVTGSGKTAAFLLPLLVYISELPSLDDSTKYDGPYAIILAPTRELVQQIELEAKKFATPLGFTCVSLIGGHSLEEQAYALRDGAEIVIATPGRLVDCIERRVLVLGQCCYVIMDEADRMIDLGFEEPVNKILDALPVSNLKPDTEDALDAVAMSQHLGGKERYRQTMMYTATMPTAVERIARKYLRRPAVVEVGAKGEAVDTVEQEAEFVPSEDKRKKRMGEILTSGKYKAPIMVFVNIKRNCDSIARDIRNFGLSSVTLHGSKTQDQREAALASIRNGSTQVLVATDVAGRGIDVPDVSLVLNFNMAPSIEAYTHRIGRTGRAGKKGNAITFLGNEDADVMYEIRQIITKSKISKLPDWLRNHEASHSKPVKGRKPAPEKGGDRERGGGKGGW
ncbi:MAG: mRNA splicing protein prp28 [Vezdaea aestivalis]|nr:MAG: mRNA splicing protein prp28 [Vezdaea aestivalis]